MPHARAAEAVGLALSVQPHVRVGMSDALGRTSFAPIKLTCAHGRKDFGIDAVDGDGKLDSDSGRRGDGGGTDQLHEWHLGRPRGTTDVENTVRARQPERPWPTPEARDDARDCDDRVGGPLRVRMEALSADKRTSRAEARHEHG